MSIHATFLVPAHAEENGYGADMAEGLREAGHAAEIRRIAGRHAPADEAARADAAAVWDALAPGTVPVLDGLALGAFADVGAAIADRFAVALIHHPSPFAGAGRAAAMELDRALLPHFARVVATSASGAERLAAEYGVDAARIAVVEPGIPDAPRSTGSGGPGCAILSFGALAPRKCHDVLMRALARLCDLDWSLRIAGHRRNAGYADELADLAAELGIAGRVTFLDEPGAAARALLWDGADLFALASRWEASGTSAARALRHGLPVAVTDGGAAAAAVTPETGVVCKPGDVDTLSKSLRRLIFDAALRRDMADAAWTLGRTFPTGAGRPRRSRAHSRPERARLREAAGDATVPCVPGGTMTTATGGPLLGCIADDFTGATDLASMLVRNGMRTVQLIGVPDAGQPPEADAIVVALKSRTAPAADAVAWSLAALAWLQRAGCRQFLFKYCSTFDSTEQGNIGPVADALVAALGCGFALACPAFPANARSVYQGHLFVGAQLLNECGMENHPLTPMTDANLVRVLGRQTDGTVALVPFAPSSAGPPRSATR